MGRCGEQCVQTVSHHTIQWSPIILQFLLHNTLHHSLSSNNSLENGNREPRPLFSTSVAVNTSAIDLGVCVHVF